MHQRDWDFVLDGEPHRVTLQYDMLSSRERLLVDGELLSDENRMTFTSEYPFQIGSHNCRAVLKVRLSYTCSLFVDGQPVELLPSKALLRPASGDEQELLRPAKSEETEADTLLRPTDAA